MMPKTKYAHADGLYIAYQVFGNGPHDLILVPGFISHLELVWEEPGVARFLERLASFSRVIMFDKRGTGLSDRGGSPPTLEERMDDVLAVMEAARSERAALFGVSEGGPMSVLFAATFPERTRALIIYGSYAKGSWSEEHPWMLKIEQYERWISRIPETWGDPQALQYWAPSVAHDEFLSNWWGKMQRMGASPGGVCDLIRLYSEIDVRPILSSVQVPTLVMHRRGDRTIRVGAGRYLAENIPNAKYVELPGVDHLWWIKEEGRISGEIEEFLMGERPSLSLERTLATVLFTDIVNSTGQALRQGDEQWLQLMDQHNRIVRQEIHNFRGREIRSTGDGFLVTFDGPSRAVYCAAKIREGMARLGLEIRAGIHTGEVELKGHELGGIGVHIAARVLDYAEASQIVVSSTVRDLMVGSGVKFEDVGKHALRGIEGEWRLFEVAET
jgi:class 3 adenylate cyclase/pimeloyl-ACP methyl ester carboxylesterase